MKEIIKNVDILTFHVPLTKTGPYKTFHLLNYDLVKLLKPGCIVINTSRGAVIDNDALLTCLKSGQNLVVALDVWENEPHISQELLSFVDIGTPHIAGHTLESRVRGAIQLLNVFSKFLGSFTTNYFNPLLKEKKKFIKFSSNELNQNSLRKLINLVYDVRKDDLLLRKKVVVSTGFDDLRKNYRNRHEYNSFFTLCSSIKSAIFLKKMGFNTILIQKNKDKSCIKSL